MTESDHGQLAFDDQVDQEGQRPMHSVDEPEERLILTVPEVAELPGVSAWLIHQQVALGVIPCVRLGRRILIPRGRLISWLESA